MAGLALFALAQPQGDAPPDRPSPAASEPESAPVPQTAAAPAVAPSPVILIEVSGAIGVGSHYHIIRGFEEAQSRGAGMIVLRMDTPGGLVTATREIISSILSSTVPVAVYVAPSGARAASAGTYISYAAHVAAMAPGTHMGAATPVQMGAPGLPGGPQKPGEDREKEGRTPSAMEAKLINDAVAYMRSLAELRGRNAEWAEQAVRTAATITAGRAAKENVIDFTATSVEDLLRQAHGRTVQLAAGAHTINSAGAPVTVYEAGWKASFISAVTNPNVAFILMLIGIYGIIFEFWNPGLTGSGIVGAICLLVGFAALAVLPLNFAGLGLLLLGLALMAAEAFAPGFGILGIGGLVAFIVGSIFLFDPAGADFDLRLAWPVVISAAATSAFFLVFVLGMAIRAFKRAVVTGSEEIAGAPALVLDWSGEGGHVRFHGEVWRASADRPMQPGQRVRVTGREGLTLQIDEPPAQPHDEQASDAQEPKPGSPRGTEA